MFEHTDKATRLKQAKEEAAKEIETYKSQRESAFQDQLKKVLKQNKGYTCSYLTYPNPSLVKTKMTLRRRWKMTRSRS